MGDEPGVHNVTLHLQAFLNLRAHFNSLKLLLCLNLWISEVNREEQKKLKSERKKEKQGGKEKNSVDNMRTEKNNEKMKEIEDWESCWSKPSSWSWNVKGLQPFYPTS